MRLVQDQTRRLTPEPAGCLTGQRGRVQLMRSLWTILVILLWPAVLIAQDTRSQVAAASDKAVESLRQQVWSLPVAPGMTVGQFAQRSRSEQLLMDGLRGADRVGGPRWLDDATCQVELELPAARVIELLRMVALGDPPEAPATPAQIAQGTRPWSTRVFRAVGVSVSADAVQDLRPRFAGSRWANVPEESRRAALRAAQQDAARRVLASIGGVALSERQTVAKALTDDSVRQAVMRWLESRPVTHVDFRENLEVEVAIAVRAGELASEIARAAGAEMDQTRQRQLSAAIAAVVTWPVGRGAVTAPARPEPAAAVALPAAPPEWVRRPLDVGGDAPPTDTKLRAAILAEQQAREALRREVEGLRLNGMTLGQAAQKDRAIERGLSRAVDEARVTRTEYKPNGAASVRLRLDGRTVWEQIRRER